MTVETRSRTSPLTGWEDVFAALPASVQLRELAFLTQLSVRVDAAGDAGEAVAKVLGVALPTTPCTSVTSGVLDVLWLGPDEWLVVAPPDAADLEAELRSAIGAAGAVVDVSAQRTTLHLTGSKARTLLAHGCSLDLHPRVTKAGACLQTNLALSGVTLVVRNDEGTDYWLLVRSSFASYLATWLVDACRELGAGNHDEFPWR